MSVWGDVYSHYLERGSFYGTYMGDSPITYGMAELHSEFRENVQQGKDATTAGFWQNLFAASSPKLKAALAMIGMDIGVGELVDEKHLTGIPKILATLGSGVAGHFAYHQVMEHTEPDPQTYKINSMNVTITVDGHSYSTKLDEKKLDIVQHSNNPELLKRVLHVPDGVNTQDLMQQVEAIREKLAAANHASHSEPHDPQASLNRNSSHRTL